MALAEEPIPQVIHNWNSRSKNTTHWTTSHPPLSIDDFGISCESELGAWMEFTLHGLQEGRLYRAHIHLNSPSNCRIGTNHIIRDQYDNSNDLRTFQRWPAKQLLSGWQRATTTQLKFRFVAVDAGSFCISSIQIEELNMITAFQPHACTHN